MAGSATGPRAFLAGITLLAGPLSTAGMMPEATAPDNNHRYRLRVVPLIRWRQPIRELPASLARILLGTVLPDVVIRDWRVE